MTTARRIDPHVLRDNAAAVLTVEAPPPVTSAPAARKLPIAAIRLDGGTQPRAEISQEHISDLADDLRAGAILPPVDVMYDGGVYWLFDGYHRLHAHKLAYGASASIDVRVHQGCLADAQWASFAVNKSHGLRRTTEDKQRAIIAALKHPNGATRSNRELARHLGVDDKTVGEWRRKLESSAEIPQIDGRTVTRGDQTYTQNTAEIGAAPRRDTYVSGLPKLDMPLRMAGADAPPTQALGTEFTVSELIDLVHACATRTGMAPALDGTPFWFQLNADVAAAGKGKRQWSVVNLRAAVKAFHPADEHLTPDADVVPSDAAHTRQQGAPLGKCRACNRPLYDPVQAAQGIGACCAAKAAAGAASELTTDDELLTAADMQVMQAAPVAPVAPLTATTLADVLRPVVTEFYEDGSDTWQRWAARDIRLNSGRKDDESGGAFWRRCIATLDASHHRQHTDWTAGLLRQALVLLADELAAPDEPPTQAPPAEHGINGAFVRTHPAATGDPRLGKMRRLVSLYETVANSFDEFGELIGRDTETLAAGREMRRLIGWLEREIAILEGRPIANTWAETAFA